MIEIPINELTLKLKELMRLARVDTQELADKLNMSQSNISKALNEGGIKRIKTKEKILEFFRYEMKMDIICKIKKKQS